MLADKPTELSRIKLKTLTRQPVPMISEHSAHLTPLSVDFRTWLWFCLQNMLVMRYRHKMCSRRIYSLNDVDLKVINAQWWNIVWITAMLVKHFHCIMQTANAGPVQFWLNRCIPKCRHAMQLYSYAGLNVIWWYKLGTQACQYACGT